MTTNTTITHIKLEEKTTTTTHVYTS